LEAVLWNSTARIEINDFKDPAETSQFVTRGNVTEQGLFKFFIDTVGGSHCMARRQSLTESRILCVIPFSSVRKRCSIVVHFPEYAGTNKEVRVYCKGAPDTLYSMISQIVTEHGTVAGIHEAEQVPVDLVDRRVE
jgi:magnesium-transporting ATPase (P-type)